MQRGARKGEKNGPVRTKREAPKALMVTGKGERRGQRSPYKVADLTAESKEDGEFSRGFSKKESELERTAAFAEPATIVLIWY
jgi:hypothetical protein